MSEEVDRVLAILDSHFRGGEQRPVLTIEEFFDGNGQDGGSLGCNLEPSIPLSRFRSTFEAVVARPEVDALWVVIADRDDIGWPFSDEVLLATTAEPGDVAVWFSSVSPSDVFEINFPVPSRCGRTLGKGVKWISVFWD